MDAFSLIIWLLLSTAVGHWGSNRGHSFWFGFIWSIILSPLAGLAIVWASGNKVKND